MVDVFVTQCARCFGSIPANESRHIELGGPGVVHSDPFACIRELKRRLGREEEKLNSVPPPELVDPFEDRVSDLETDLAFATQKFLAHDHRLATLQRDSDITFKKLVSAEANVASHERMLGLLSTGYRALVRAICSAPSKMDSSHLDAACDISAKLED